MKIYETKTKRWKRLGIILREKTLNKWENNKTTVIMSIQLRQSLEFRIKKINI